MTRRHLLTNKVKTLARRTRALIDSSTRQRKPLSATPVLDKQRFLFVCGLHRSGTSILHRILREHPDTSGFHKSGARQDEGQHLQSVFPTAAEHGGPGKFAFDPDSHLTEASTLVSDANRQKLLREWGAYTDFNKLILLEKSPPNIVRSRFLQALFPDSIFVFIVRHPIAVSLSTQKWTKTPLIDLLNHWHKAHEIMRDDLGSLNSKLVLRYEDMIEFPEDVLSKVCRLAEIKPFTPDEGLENHNDKYFSEWLSAQAADSNLMIGQHPEILSFANSFGYFFEEPFVGKPTECIVSANGAWTSDASSGGS